MRLRHAWRVLRRGLPTVEVIVQEYEFRPGGAVVTTTVRYAGRTHLSDLNGGAEAWTNNGTLTIPFTFECGAL